MKYRAWVVTISSMRYVGHFPTYEMAERAAQRSCGSKNPSHYIIEEIDIER